MYLMNIFPSNAKLTIAVCTWNYNENECANHSHYHLKNQIDHLNWNKANGHDEILVSLLNIYAVEAAVLLEQIVRHSVLSIWSRFQQYINSSLSCLFLDISKEFDKMCHKRILFTLKLKSGSLFNVFENYLLHMYKSVVLDGLILAG